MPIGLIGTNVGGTAAQRWTPKEVLQSTPDLEKYAQENNSSDLYNAMIHPLLPFNIRGAIWYQGESNAGQAYRYRALFPAMIKSWRDRWNVGEFPFLFVQLAPFAPNDSTNQTWAELREAQLMTLDKSPNTAMAVITDVGEEKDIHPKQKKPVGERLALAALAKAYGEKIDYSGPLFESMSINGKQAVLRFKHAESGLEAARRQADWLRDRWRRQKVPRGRGANRKRHDRRQQPAGRAAGRRALWLGQHAEHEPVEQGGPAGQPVPHRQFPRRDGGEVTRT